MFENNRVDAESVSDFLDRYYKKDRYHGRGADYAAALLASHEHNFEVNGYDIISRHDSVTGEVVAFFGKQKSLMTNYNYRLNELEIRLDCGCRFNYIAMSEDLSVKLCSLHASAPQMLRALNKALDHLDNHYGWRNHIEVTQELRAAIEKARKEG